MAQITLRTVLGKSSPDDLILSVQDRTHEHLLTTISPEVRILAFLVEDSNVAESYADVYVSDDCPYESIVTKIIPGSRTRKGIELPGEMTSGEQLTILVDRRPRKI